MGSLYTSNHMSASLPVPDLRGSMSSIWAPIGRPSQQVADVRDRSTMSSIWAPRASPESGQATAPHLASTEEVQNSPTRKITPLVTPPDSITKSSSKERPLPLDPLSTAMPLGDKVEANVADGDVRRGLLWTQKWAGIGGECRQDSEDVFGKLRLGAIGDERHAPKHPINAGLDDYFGSMSPPRSPELDVSRPRSNTIPGFRPSDMAQNSSGYGSASGAPYSSQPPHQNGRQPHPHLPDNALSGLQTAFDSLSVSQQPLSSTTSRNQSPPFLNSHARSQSHPYMANQWQSPPSNTSPMRQRQSTSPSRNVQQHQQQYPQHLAQNNNSLLGLPPPVPQANRAWDLLPNTTSTFPAPVGRTPNLDAASRSWHDPRWAGSPNSDNSGDLMGGADNGWVSFQQGDRRSQTLSPINTAVSDSPLTHGGMSLSSTTSSTGSGFNQIRSANVGNVYTGPGIRPASHTPPPNRHRSPAVHPQHQHHHGPPAAHQHQPNNPNQPINYLSYLQAGSEPPYGIFCDRIARSSDQQASIFLQQKLKIADGPQRSMIIDAVVERGFELMTNRFGNWAVQRCLEDPCTLEEKTRIVAVMRGRIVELSMSPYGTHVVQKALDCDENAKHMIVSELLMGDPGETLVNKHASHVWSKIMELQWEGPPPPIFEFVNISLQGKWAQLACHETGSLVVQHVFENLSEELKTPCVEEVLDNLTMCAKNQWGSWVVQHIIEHGSPNARARALSIMTNDLLALATDQQGVKSLDKALKIGDPTIVDGFVHKMAEPRATPRRSIIVDVALSAPGSQFIAQILPTINREQRNLLHDAIRTHIVTLKGSRTGAKVIWMFDKLRNFCP